MDTIRYVFETKQPQLNKLVVKYGLTPATGQKDLWMKTNFLATKFREDFMKDIADIHPDRDLFAWRFSLDKPKEKELARIETNPSTSELQNILDNTTIIPPSRTRKSKVSNACGCSGADGENTSGCGGEKTSGCCGSGADGEKTSGCSGCEAMKKSSITGTEIKEKLQNNMPLVIVGSLALVVGLIALSNRKLI